MNIANRIASFIPASPARVTRRPAEQTRPRPSPVFIKTQRPLPTIAALCKRLKYINMLAKNFEKASTPFEERLLYKRIVMVYASLRHSGLIKAAVVKPSLFAQPRRHATRVLIKYMRSKLIAAIATHKPVKRSSPKLQAPPKGAALQKRRVSRPLYTFVKNLPEKRSSPKLQAPPKGAALQKKRVSPPLYTFVKNLPEKRSSLKLQALRKCTALQKRCVSRPLYTFVKNLSGKRLSPKSLAPPKK